MMKNYLIISLIISFFLINGCSKKPNINVTDDLAQPEIVSSDIDSLKTNKEYEGKLYISRNIDILVKVDGTLKEIHVSPGQNVNEGDLLYTIINTKYEDALKAAKAARAEAEKDKERFSHRLQELQKRDVRKKNIDVKELNKIKEDLQNSIAKIEVAKNNLRSAEILVEMCQIKAPFKGVISDHRFKIGDFINGEKEPVVINTIGNDKVLKCEVTLDRETYINLIKLIDQQNINLDSVPVKAPSKNIIYYAHLSDSLPEIPITQKNVTLEFIIDNSYDVLENGMDVKIVLPMEIDNIGRP